MESSVMISADEENQDCVMEVIFREIINTQNHQIQQMLRYLKSEDFPITDDCVIEIETIRVTESADCESSGAFRRRRRYSNQQRQQRLQGHEGYPRNLHIGNQYIYCCCRPFRWRAR